MNSIQDLAEWLLDMYVRNLIRKRIRQYGIHKNLEKVCCVITVDNMKIQFRKESGRFYSFQVNEANTKWKGMSTTDGSTLSLTKIK